MKVPKKKFQIMFPLNGCVFMDMKKTLIKKTFMRFDKNAKNLIKMPKRILFER